MKKQNKGKMVWRYGFALVVILAGLILEYYNIKREFIGFDSVGKWMIYVGFVMIAIITLQKFFGRNKIVDERVERVGYLASRITFLFIIFCAFIVMIIDGVKSIEVPYSIFISYAVCAIVLVYFIAFKVFDRRAI